ncbi:dihydrofolate reductase [Yamadazyma tenuis]|uniref:Dihydrofolate reductase n=1 Tax=Candida tenuis (strain ATCC 10573 / BCRC 21748 / CBS 615 / JCM 9827 / NBRC 10315 / NRRL Y-1498 / VKM Y-70) TaxID=590646 RepID=G3BED0_CANTC|nr:dihydrofolate reductase [Yamadazyma tenuis ATCC 10573]EGV61172.1 dihydrofolate reductase [Yamadazyma tenuis ATCC 10573]WEJ94244.1 dihydrofolate reductase [Yamadazyma tenuis]
MKSITPVVAALMPNLGIGYKGKLPWRLSKEIINFKNITCKAADNKRNAVIMGRKTWESIPKKFKPLPDRLNIVLTRTITEEHTNTDDLIYLNDFNKISSVIDDSIDKVFLIGGSELYNHLFKSNVIDSIILTELHTENSVEIDTFLDWDLTDWVQKSHEDLLAFAGIDLEPEYNEKGYTYKYSLYQRQ